MNYIWDITLQAHIDGIKKNQLFFEQGANISPWYEQSFPNINQNRVEDTRIEINSLYRFDNIFGKYLQDGFLEHIDFKKYFFDLVIHFLCEVDLSKGITK